MTGTRTTEIRPSGVSVQTLGPVRVLRDGRPVPTLEPRLRNLAILILLGMERELERDRLASYVWADREPRRARQSLSEALYELRKHLGEDWFESHGGTIRATAQLDVDAIAFRTAADRGEPSSALPLYRGHFLRGFSINVSEFEQWADGHERELFSAYRNAADRAIMAARERGDLRAALLVARNWVDLRPDDDEAQHCLIALLALNGDRAAALRQNDSYCRLLAEMELTPLDRTLALVSAARAGDLAAIEPLVRLSADEQAATDRPTQRWFTRPQLGPRLVLIGDPKEVDGRTIPIGRSVRTVGPGGDLPIGGREAGSEVLATLTRDTDRDGVMLAPHGAGRQVYVLISGPRVLRPGEAFRVGQQVFTLERADD